MKSFLTRVLVSFGPLAASLRNRRFAEFSIGNLLSFVGAWMQRIVLGWLIWELTHSGFWLGVLVACDFGPAIVLGPIGGVLGDRYDQARVILLTQAAIALNGFALGVVAAFHAAPAPVLIGFALISGVLNALSDAARLSIVRRMVTDETLAASIAVTSVSFNLARFLGPAVGGAVLSTAGSGAAFALAALLCGPFIWALLRVGPVPPAVRSEAERKHWLTDVQEGIAYTFRHADIARTFAIFLLCAALVRPAYELMPGVVGALFDGDVKFFTAMIAAIGLGAVIAALNLTRAADPRVMADVVMRGAIGSAIAVAVVAISPSTILALAAAVVLGYFVSTNANGALIFAQTQADIAFQARVASLWSVIVRSAPGIGALGVGWLADRVGFRWPVVTTAMLCIAASIAVFYWRRGAKA